MGKGRVDSNKMAHPVAGPFSTALDEEQGFRRPLSFISHMMLNLQLSRSIFFYSDLGF